MGGHFESEYAEEDVSGGASAEMHWTYNPQYEP